MKGTGKMNPFTGEEIMILEESDIKWRDVDWKELSWDEKADFCSLNGIRYLNKDIEPKVIDLYGKYRMRHFKKNYNG